MRRPMARYALSNCVRRDMPVSGLALIPRAEDGDVLIPPYSGSESPEAASNFLTLWSSWSIQLGFSPDLNKQLLEEYFKKVFSLPSPKSCKTWTEFVECFCRRHRISNSATREFQNWYDDCAKKIAVVWFSYGELERATDGFSERCRVGQGSAGIVYEGHLPFHGGQRVAVKTLKQQQDLMGSNQNQNQNQNRRLDKVLAEVDLHRELTPATHPDVVRLIGFCTFASNPLLVSEFVAGGNLRHHLEGIYGDALRNSPRARLSVAIDVANALVQLHYRGAFPIFHGDVRSTNVLLDVDSGSWPWRAKLSDLGMAMGIRNETCKKRAPFLEDGSRGYMDPVYEYTGELHDKTDVFSYGVILMELVTLKKVWDASRREKSLVDLVVTRTRGAHPYSVIGSGGHPIPPGREEEHYGGGILEMMMHVAVWCCDYDLDKRPTIAEVADYLQAFRRSGSPRRWMKAKDLVGDQRGRLGWDWEHQSPIISPRDPD